MDGFQAAEEAYVLAIRACCTPTVRQESPATPFTTPLPPSPSRPPPLPPAPRRASAGAPAVDASEVRRALFAEGGREGDRAVARVSGAAAAPDAAATAVSPSPAGARGGDAKAAERSPGIGADAAPGSGLGTASSPTAGAEEGGGARVEKRPAAGEVGQEDLEWFVVPGGRERPPELDEDGNEKAPAAAAGMGGATGVDGAVDLVGQRSAGGSTGDGAAAEMAAVSPRVGEAAATSGGGGGADAAASRENGDGMMSASPPPPPVASRVGAVNVLSPAAATSASARGVAGSSGDRSVPRAAPAEDAVGAGSCADSGNGGGSPAEEDGERIEWQRAMAILDDMEAADHLPPPPAEAFQAVLDACVAAGRVGEALEVASAMVGTGHSPSKRLISRLMESHADVLEREKAEMEEAAAEPAEAWGTDE